MKKLLLTIVLSLTAASVPAFPTTNAPTKVILSWDASPDAAVTGYWVYAATNSFWSGSNQVLAPTLLSRTDASNSLSCVVGPLPAGVRIYFVVTARNAFGLESDYSNEVAFTLPTKPAPARLKLEINVQASASADGPWGNLACIPWEAEVAGDASFYRALVMVERE
jgi:hypothetical protein